MSLVVLYLGTRYDVCECNSLRDVTISSFLWSLTFLLWPSRSLLFLSLDGCYVLVPSTKFVGLKEFEIWTIVWRKLKWRHNDVICHFNFMKFKHKSTKPWRVYLNDKLNFILIKCKRAEIKDREVNKELWRKKWHYVTVTLTFDPR